MMRAKSILSLLLALFCVAALCGATPVEADATPTELTFITLGDKPSGYDLIWDEVNAWLERDLNANVQWEYLGWSDNKSQMSLKFSAGEKVDVIYVANWLGYAEFAAKNAYYELTMDKIEQYMPLTYEDLPPIAWEQAKVDGKIYTVPQGSIGRTTVVFGVRGDLMKKYGLESITTNEDIIAYWKAAGQDEDLDRAMTYMEDNFFVNMSHSWEGVSGGSAYTMSYAIEDEDLNVFSYVFTDEYLEFAKMCRDLFEAGCWSADAINDTSDASVLWDSGLIASISQNFSAMSGTVYAAQQAHPDWDVQLVDLTQGIVKQPGSFVSNGWSIGATTENPELTMQVLDKLRSDSAYNHMLIYGIEGTHWEKVGDNGYRLLEARTNKDDPNYYSQGVLWGFGSAATELRAEAIVSNYDEIVSRWDTEYQSSLLSAFNFNIQDVQTEAMLVSDVVSTYNNPMRFGMYEDTEAAVQEYRDALTQAGIDTLLSECASQIAAWRVLYED